MCDEGVIVVNGDRPVNKQIKIINNRYIPMYIRKLSIQSQIVETPHVFSLFILYINI